MPPASPSPASTAMPSPRSSSAGPRPALMKRNSSQGQTPYASRQGNLRSPGSELDFQPLRHAVRPKGHARVVLPRNHSSGRNLAKLARQAAAAGGENGNGKVHGRQRSHEGDTEIRLPGSLGDSEARPAPIRRNMTSYQLPRNTSHTKLKKNFSHGQLQRLGSGKDLVGLAQSKQRAPPSPALKGKQKALRNNGEDEMDLHEQEVELARRRDEQSRKDEKPKQVGFAVGGDDSEAEHMPSMEGSGMDEGDWTEESASASPFSTRQNTADNSRRPSVQERSHDNSSLSHVSSRAQEPDDDEDEDEDEVDSSDDDGSSSHSESEEEAHSTSVSMPARPDPQTQQLQSQSRPQPQPQSQQSQQQPQPRPPPQRSPLHAAKEHPNPTTQFIGRNSGQLPAPALVSNVTAMDGTRSLRTSPAASLRSSQSNFATEQDSDELVSRFVPGTSTGSGSNTTMQNTPKTSTFYTPENDTRDQRYRSAFSLGPVSPGSTVSGSSGAATPALGRSRIELKMLQEKAIADMESAAEKGPIIPAHVYDRRNESLKSYLQLAALHQSGGATSSGIPPSLGPEIFQGRFKAVNTELRVVQKFRNPVAESVARLQTCQGTKLNLRASPQNKAAAALRMTKSAVSLPARGAAAAATAVPAPPQAVKDASSSFSTSVSPPKSENQTRPKPALTTAKSLMNADKPVFRRSSTRGVSFAGADERSVREADTAETQLNEVLRELWDDVLA